MNGRQNSAYLRALEALEALDYAEARLSFTEAISSGPAPRWEALYGRAWAVLADDDYRSEESIGAAAEDLERAAAMAPTSSDIAILRGRVAYLQGDRETAVRHLLVAAGRGSQRKLAETNLVDALSDLLWSVENERGRPEGVELCTRLVRMVQVSALPLTVRDKLLAEVYASRAYCWQLLGNEAEATADLLRLSDVAPGHPRLPARLPSAVTSVDAADAPDSDPTFSSVGGADEPGSFVAELGRIFDVYLSEPDPQATRRRLAEFGQAPSRSLLLFGPSGCGKTYIVKAFGGEYRRRHGREIPLLTIKLDEVFGRYVGENEQNLTRVFDQAIEMQPSILFCDEIDGLGSSRESGESWRQETTGHFLQQVDRLKDEGAAVIFFGCTNRVWAVDLALLRRFDRLIPAGMPDEKIRGEIFSVHLEKVSAQRRGPDIDTAELARRSHGLTPGEIKKVVAKATDNLLSNGSANGMLSQAHLLAALPGAGEISPLQEWLRQSLAALRAIGQEDMADTVRRTYGPYADDLDVVVVGPTRRAVIPPAAWTEAASYDLSLMRSWRERL